MAHKYAVLWSVDGPTSLPLGLAVDYDDHVLVDVPDHMCVRAKQRGEYRVMHESGTFVTYRPGSPGYFEQVLLDLSSMFAIGERGELDDAEPGAVMHLLRTLVIQPLQSKTVTPYKAAYPVGRYHAVETPAQPTPGELTPVGV